MRHRPVRLLPTLILALMVGMVAAPLLIGLADPQSAVSAKTPRATPRPKPTARPTAVPTPTPKPMPTPGACSTTRLFPSTNVWNKDVAGLPVRGDSTTLLNTIGLDIGLHPDFDAIGDGIPYNIVTDSTPRYTVGFYYPDESDPGPYPIPSNPLIEAGSDRHILLWNQASCHLYEIYDASLTGGVWSAGSGATWDLTSNALRPDTWTSADAAGLPILPGLVRYDEVGTGAILHALRFTAPVTRSAHIYPARHDAGSGTSASLPPMGLRVRLKASFNIGGFDPKVQVLLTALKRYGMILADNGSPWYISGVPDARWNDDAFHLLNQVRGSDFEVVDTTGFVNGP